MAGMTVSCPTCQADLTIPATTKSPTPAVHPALQYLAQNEIPKAVGACIRLFQNYGLLNVIVCPMILVYLISVREAGFLTFFFLAGVTVLGVLSFVTAHGIKQRRTSARTQGQLLASLMLVAAVAGSIGAFLVFSTPYGKIPVLLVAWGNLLSGIGALGFINKDSSSWYAA